MGLLEDLASIILASKRVPQLPLMGNAADSDYLPVYSTANSRIERILVSTFRAYANVAFNTVYFGSVTTAGDTTTETEIENFINTAGFSIGTNQVKLLEATIYLGGVAYRRTYVYRPNTAGAYGTTPANPINYSDLQILNTEPEAASEENQVIDLGDIGSDDPWTHINALADGTVYELDAGTVYQFSAVKDGDDVDYLYIGVLPNIIGDGGNAVSSTDFYQLVAAGTVAASDVTFNPSGLSIITDTVVQGALAEVDAALLKAKGTEVLSGTDGIAINADTTKYDLGSDIIGQIKDSTGYYPIEFTAQTAITLTNIASSSVWVYIDKAGALQEQTTTPTRADWYSKLFIVRFASNGTNILAFELLRNPSGQYTNSVREIYDYLVAAGVPLRTGLTITPNADLTFARSAGTTLEIGAGTEETPNTPSHSAVDPANLFIQTQNATIAANTNDVNVTQYDVAGTATTLANNKYVAHRLYFFNSGNHTLQLGQTEYSSLEEAEANVLNEAYVLNPANLNGEFLGWWIVKKNTTDLQDTADAVFKEYSIGGTSGAVLADVLLKSNNLSDVSDADTARDNLNAEKKLGVVAAANVVTSYTIDHNNKFWQLLTMTGATTFSDSNLIVDGVTRGMYLTGDFAPTFPAYWTADVNSDTYDGTKICRITWDVEDDTVSSEEVWYNIEIITA